MASVKPTARSAAPKSATGLSGVSEGPQPSFDAATLPPVHPGEILMEDFLRPLGIGTTVAAQRMGLPRTRIERVVRGEVGISADTALRLEAFLGAPARVWLNLQALYELDVALANRDAALQNIRPWTTAS